MSIKSPSAEKVLKQAYQIYSFKELKDLPDDALVNLTLLLEEKIIEHGDLIPWSELRAIRDRANKYPDDRSLYFRPRKPPLPKHASFLEQRLHIEFEPESLKRQIVHDEWRRQVWLENNAKAVTKQDIIDAMLAVSTRDELEALSPIERRNFASVVLRRLRKAGPSPTLDELQGLKELALEHLWCQAFNTLGAKTDAKDAFEQAKSRTPSGAAKQKNSLEDAAERLAQTIAISMRYQ